ncbi:MAG: zinc metalloprotease HtpX [Syntrophobacteraceae bacterium]|nr:zinc metalloprotease HtpX [Syntrophobacteraceae bacterium]
MIESKIKTTLLLAVLTGVVIWIGGMVGGRGGMFVAFLLAIVMNAGSYWFSDRIVLAMYHARPVEQSDNPQLFLIVRELAQEAGLPMPRVYVIPQQAPNAFATGRNPEHAAVAVTEGILRILTASELKGVLGHELGHVRNRDILISSIAATLAGAIMILASMARWAAIFGGFGGRDDREGGALGLLVTAILAPFAATLIQLAISRNREYLADQTGARLSHNPEGLAGALEKLEAASTRLPMDASPSTAHMFIVNPLSGKSLAGLFTTHPPIEERIRRLRSMR